VDFIEARVKQAVAIQTVPALFLAQPVFMELEPAEVVAPLAVALGDVLKSRRMKPYVAATLVYCPLPIVYANLIGAVQVGISLPQRSPDTSTPRRQWTSSRLE
jgi:hypothetical protein